MKQSIKNQNKLKFINEKGIRNDANDVFQKTSDFLAKLLPDAKIEHVGGTAIPGALTKGDIDIQVRISQKEFAKAKKILNEHFEIDANNPPTKDYAGFIDRKSKIPIGIQLTVKNSKYDDFYKIRDILKKDKKLLKEYNSLKKKFQGKSMEEYRKEKEKFLEKILKDSK